MDMKQADNETAKDYVNRVTFGRAVYTKYGNQHAIHHGDIQIGYGSSGTEAWRNAAKNLKV